MRPGVSIRRSLVRDLSDEHVQCGDDDDARRQGWAWAMNSHRSSGPSRSPRTGAARATAPSCIGQWGLRRRGASATSSAMPSTWRQPCSGRASTRMASAPRRVRFRVAGRSSSDTRGYAGAKRDRGIAVTKDRGRSRYFVTRSRVAALQIFGITTFRCKSAELVCRLCLFRWIPDCSCSRRSDLKFTLS